VLAHARDGNADIKALLREIGDRRLRYGAVAIGGEAGVGAGASTMTLNFDLPENFTALHNGQVYVG
jgi:hypothetical protein